MSGWRDRLDSRQQKEVDFAGVYVAEFGHGTPGHNHLVLINKLSGLLDESADPSPPDPEAKRLPVPYHSQHEADAEWFRKDCGPACVEMVGEWARPERTAVTTNEIMRFITAGVDRSIYIGELQRASEHFYEVGLERHGGASWEDLKYWIDKGLPAIVLVHYGSFAGRMDRGFNSGHFMVVAGRDSVDYQGETIERIILHDPDWYGGKEAQGAFIPVVKDHFMAMWEDCYKDGNPRRMALVPEVAR